MVRKLGLARSPVRRKRVGKPREGGCERKRPNVLAVAAAWDICRRVDGKHPSAPPATEARDVDRRVDGKRPSARNPGAQRDVCRRRPRITAASAPRTLTLLSCR
jgi:hypothetical protein